MTSKILDKVGNGYLLTVPDEDETTGNFVIPAADKVPQTGKVLKVGGPGYHPSGKFTIPPPAKIGDRILHSGYGFENFYLNGILYRIVPFDKVLGIIKEVK
jgi:co-chaperonin GroES (HSP10)